jgi:phenylpropionate dioxygenase-like ring-hydroxylating dioxygenase large terminal subunit
VSQFRSSHIRSDKSDWSRHRAFPVVQEACGNAKIFSCKYHGWSYDLSGKLTKAPRFTPDLVDGFDPSERGLFPIHIHVDRNGFVFANLDAKETPDISWEEQYEMLDQQEVFVSSGVDWDSVEFDLTWSKDGQFNWKLMQDNYNEVSPDCFYLDKIGRKLNFTNSPSAITA